MLVGFYESANGSYEGFSDLALEGDPEDLLNLAALLEKNERVVSIPLCFKDVEPSPYEGVLTCIRAEVANRSKLLVKRAGTDLEISGSREHTEILAHNMRVSAQQALEMEPSEHAIERHVHEEWHPRHFYLDEDSDPLVIAAKNRNP